MGSSIFVTHFVKEHVHRRIFLTVIILLVKKYDFYVKQLHEINREQLTKEQNVFKKKHKIYFVFDL